MRILLIHNYYRWWGGEDNYFESLKKLLGKKGHKVFIYTKDNKNIKSILDTIKTVFGMFWNQQTEKEIEKIIKIYKPQIAQIQNIYPLISPTVYRVLKRNKIPIIQRISNPRLIYIKDSLNYYKNSKIASLFFTASIFYHKLIGSYNKIDYLLFPTDNTKNILNIKEKKTIVIPTFSLEPRNISKIKKSGYFVFVGRLSEEKGIIPLLEIFKQLPIIKIIIIGDGDLKNKLVSKYKEKNIIFKGNQKKKIILNYLSNAMATIIPSEKYDVLPNVLIESYSVGTPVIGPEHGSFLNLIKSNKTGLFYKFQNYNDLKKKIIFVYSNKQKMKSMGILAKEEYLQKYSSSKIYTKLINSYSKVIKNT